MRGIDRRTVVETISIIAKDHRKKQPMALALVLKTKSYLPDLTIAGPANDPCQKCNN